MSFYEIPRPVVVDASVAIELVNGDAGWRHAFTEWGTDNRLLLCPPLFLAEVANGLIRGRTKMSGADALISVARLIEVGIENSDRGISAIQEAVILAERHDLTVYDALYLQLALDVDGELATLDSDLRRAAIAEDVTLSP